MYQAHLHMTCNQIGALVMFIRNINFDSGLGNGKKRVVRGLSAKIVDVEVIAQGFPIVKIPRICFETQVGHEGITFHRHQFSLRLCYAMTINKSQGQTLHKVNLDLRDDVFTHGQLYVALSRTTSRENILCLVKTNRLRDNAPHVANVVFREFIFDATGREPLYLNVNSSGNGKSTKSNTDTDSDSSSVKDSDSDNNSDNSENSSHDNSNEWTIVNEIGDGACLFRCIARKVHGDPDSHFITRQKIQQHIRDHLYDPIPLFDISSNDIISGGLQSNSVATLGQSHTLYTSVGHYLNLMSNAYAYATHIEITAANHLFNININVTFADTNYPSTYPEPNSCNVLYDPITQHYSSLQYHG